jgi:AcrR family transcriptional regulator
MPNDASKHAEPALGNGVARAEGPARRGLGRTSPRARLVKAIVPMAAQDGCLQVQVGALARRAGVSRATFYEVFPGKEDCFLAAQREVGERLMGDTRRAASESAAPSIAKATVTALVDFADQEPLAFNFLMREALLAGPRSIREHGRLLATLEREIENAWDQLPDSAATPDLPATILLAGIIGVLGIHIRRGQGPLTDLRGDLLAWIDSYAVPRHAQRWMRITPSGALSEANQRTSPGSLEPPPVPRGRHRVAGAVVKRVQRERILYATAEAARSKGCANATVADIVTASGMSREVFYEHFHNKREALQETAKMVFEKISGVTAAAFFGSPGTWPERVWQAGRAYSEFLAGAPTFAHFALVESTALDTVGAPRVDDFALGFTVFLEDGYRQRPQAAEVPRLVSEAIAGTVLETAALYSRQDRTAELPGLVPLSTFIILAPFIGVDAAREFVDAKSTAEVQRVDEPPTGSWLHD